MIKKVSTDKAPAAIGPYSQAVIANKMLFASGQIPINPEIAKAVDAGKIEELDLPWLTKAITKIL